MLTEHIEIIWQLIKKNIQWVFVQAVNSFSMTELHVHYIKAYNKRVP